MQSPTLKRYNNFKTKKYSKKDITLDEFIFLDDYYQFTIGVNKVIPQAKCTIENIKDLE